MKITRRIHEFSEIYKKVKEGYSLIWKIAKILSRDGNSKKIAQTLGGFLGYLSKLTHSEQIGEVAKHIIKWTHIFWKGLFTCYDNPILPKTNNDLEQRINRTKRTPRKISGRKSTHNSIIRYGDQLVYVEDVLKIPNFCERVALLSEEEILLELKKNRLRTNQYRKKHRAKHHLKEFLRETEKYWEIGLGTNIKDTS